MNIIQGSDRCGQCAGKGAVLSPCSCGSVSGIYNRRLNKQRSVFPSDTALLKALYLSTHEIAKKWTMPLRNWGRVLGELEIMYPDRLG